MRDPRKAVLVGGEMALPHASWQKPVREAFEKLLPEPHLAASIFPDEVVVSSPCIGIAAHKQAFAGLGVPSRNVDSFDVEARGETNMSFSAMPPFLKDARPS